MAKRDEIQYVRYYAVGSTARKLEPKRQPRRRAAEQAAPKPEEQRIPIYFDRTAVLGTALAVVMLLCVVFGFGRVNRLNQQIADMEAHIAGLRAENYGYQKDYANGVDLDDVRAAAEAMGLVPMEQVRHITVHIPQPEEPQELPWWQELWNDWIAMFESFE